jgi:hypothetical protein
MQKQDTKLFTKSAEETKEKLNNLSLKEDDFLKKSHLF